MKTLAIVICLLALAFNLLLWPAAAETSGVDDEKEKVGKSELAEEERTIYALGLAMARSLHNLGLTEPELEVLVDGLKDSVLQRPAKVEMYEYGRRIPVFMKDRSKATVARETAASAPFLKAEAEKTGAVQTGTGLIYIEEKKGQGATPGATDTVTVHYHGMLRDGTVFDSSVERGDPATFALNRVIPGWTEGLQRMKVGGKARLICPANIAYGNEGSPPKILGGAVLVFDVELIAIREHEGE